MSLLPILTLQQSQALQDVTRWHTRRTLRHQSVLEHSALVGLVALHLVGAEFSAAEIGELLHLALLHDAHEAAYGDIPYPAKRALERDGIDIDSHCRWEFWGGRDPYQIATPRVVDALEVADVLEAALFAVRYAPEIADLVADQAVAAARARLDNVGVARVLEALGRSVEVHCG
jgi:hypothetical protein